MNINKLITDQFDENVDVQIKTKVALTDVIALSCQKLAKALQDGYKIVCCGNGGSAADAQHFSAELLNRFELERTSLPAIALTTDTSTITAIANDYSFDEIFSKQISAIGKKNDYLIAITTSGNSNNILKAITTAHKSEMKVIVLSGKNGGFIANSLKEDDIELRVPSIRTCRIQEAHELILHTICHGIDSYLFQKGE